MSKSPQTAIKKLSNRPDWMAVFQEFMVLMGNELETQTAKQGLDPHEQAVIDKVTAHPRAKQVLADPGIQSLLAHLRTRPMDARQ